jgi:uncharacterized membrane protein
MRRLRRRPSLGGLTVALQFWWLSLAPSLLPRGWLAQGLVSAVCLLAGYGVGTLLAWIGQLVLRRTGRELGDRARRLAWTSLGVAAVAVLVTGSVFWLRWQNEHRALLSMDDVSGVVVVPMLALTAAVVLVLGLLCRLVWWLIRGVDAWFDRRVPRPFAVTGTVAVVVFGTQLVVQEVIWDGFTAWANNLYSAADIGTDAGTVQPRSANVSGSPQSLVRWDDLGVKGRNFVAEATSEEELAAFHKPDVELAEPIRVYVGGRSTTSNDDQVALAVRELERTRAFDRPVLVVATATGTGWVNPRAATAIEHLYAGDTAIVSIQYSYLPSWIAFLIDADASAPAGSALFDAVHERWSELPEGSRPKLLVFGESLGSYGSEAAFAGFDAQTSIANMVARTDGALFTGPIFNNMIWSGIGDEREADSPVWRPVFDGGRTVRVVNRPSELARPDPMWHEPRILYLHHPSDPVGVFSFRTLWSRPEWTHAPKGHGVPERTGWFPIVTWVHTVADLAYAFYAPEGYGHNYGSEFAGGWANVAPPDGWTSGDTLRLQRHLTPS